MVLSKSFFVLVRHLYELHLALDYTDLMLDMSLDNFMAFVPVVRPEGCNSLYEKPLFPTRRMYRLWSDDHRTRVVN